MESLPRLADDGLLTPVVGAWSENKYRHLKNYAEMFAMATKGKWGCRVYLDLFSGAGRVLIENTNQILRGSPLIALSVEDSFDQLIFCEADTEKLNVLQARVERDHPASSVDFVAGDANANVDQILSKLPQHRRGSLAA